MENTSKTERLPRRDVYYFRRRFVNRVYSELVAFFAKEAEQSGATKSKIAKRLGCDPAQITRWLKHPSNLELETISDLLLALDAEAEPPQIVKFSERKKANYAHPVVEHVTSIKPMTMVVTVGSTTSGERPWTPPLPGMMISNPKATAAI